MANIEYCEACESLDESCCAASKRRLETSTALARLVDRESKTITRLTRELSEARQVSENLQAYAQKLEGQLSEMRARAVA